MAYGMRPITIFHGEEYFPTPRGHNVGFGWFGSKIAHSVGHFASNAIKTAGKAVGTVTKPIQSVTGAVTKVVGKIPVVGGPLHTVFNAGFHAAMGPANMTVAIAEGKRIDKAVVGQIKEQLHDIKQVAPYAQMVMSVVPGVGTGVSAALSAGLALSEGQSVGEALKAGAIGAMPGGPLVKAAVTMGTETIQHVAKGERVNLQSLSQTAGGIASSALGLPIAAKNALMAGIATTGAIASGKPIDKALTDSAVSALPISDNMKKAMTEASALSLDLANGRKLDSSVTARINALAAMAPSTSPLRINVKTSLDSIAKIGQGNAEKAMATALQSGLADTLVSMGAQPLPADAQKAIKTGIALGSGVIFQELRKLHIGDSLGKLVESGVQLSKTNPLFGEARKIAAVKNATQGFDIACGLLQHQVGLYDLGIIRDSLDPTQKIGFDIATAVRVGAVSNPKPPTLSAAAHAGYATTLGMQSYDPDNKAAIMQAIQANPSATVGATVAIKEVAKKRDSWITKLLKALHLTHIPQNTAQAA